MLFRSVTDNSARQQQGQKQQQKSQGSNQQQQQNRQTNKTGAPKGPPPGEPQVFDKECFICGYKNDHWTAQCSNPKNRSPNSILKSCSKNKACFNCLRSHAGHDAKDCTQGHCRREGCVSKHHTLLHDAEWGRLAELMKEAQQEMEKKMQHRAAKAEKVASQENTTNNTQGKGSSGKNNRRPPKRKAPDAPTKNQQRSNATTQQVETAQSDSK